jgi:transcriptional regulator with XRE-family HTH domain
VTENPHIGGDALDFLESITPDTPETRRVEKQELFRIALTQAMRDLRNRMGLTQKELAEKLGIGQSWVSKLESANNDHTFESVLTYLDAMGASFQALILLNNEKIAQISSDPNLSSPSNPACEALRNPENATSERKVNTPEFKSIPPENMPGIDRAQQMSVLDGLWGMTEGVAA